MTQLNWILNKGKGCTYLINFKYKFLLENEFFTGDTYEFGGLCYEGDFLKIRNHTSGTIIDIYYDPTDPKTNVIVPGKLSDRALGGLFFTPIAVIAFIVSTILLYRFKE